MTIRLLPLVVRRFLPLLLVFSLGGCTDSPEKVIDDQIAVIEELTEIIDRVADGSLAQADAVKRMSEVEKRLAKVRERAAGLGPEMSLVKPAQQRDEKLRQALRGMVGAMAKLQKSGRATPEITAAVAKLGGGKE